MFDVDALLPSSPLPAESPAAGSAADESDESDKWIATHCGACFEMEDSFAHVCKLGAIDQTHKVPLHSNIVCEDVVMPIEGYYFCSMGCLHAYNVAKSTAGIQQVMPDDGHGNQPGENFQLPARRRPDAAIEQPSWEVDAEQEPEAASSSAIVVHGGEERLMAHGAEDAVPEDAARLDSVGTRVVIDDVPGVVFLAASFQTT